MSADKRIVRRGSGSVVTWRRAQMVLWSAQGMSVAQIAGLAFTSEDRGRDVLHNFNLFAALELGTDKIYGRTSRNASGAASSSSSAQPAPAAGADRDRLRQLQPAPFHQLRQARRAVATASNAEIACTPTNSSWINRLECQFTALREFNLNGTDHATHREQGSMIRRYIAWRNRHTAYAASSNGQT